MRPASTLLCETPSLNSRNEQCDVTYNPVDPSHPVRQLNGSQALSLNQNPTALTQNILESHVPRESLTGPTNFFKPPCQLFPTPRTKNQVCPLLPSRRILHVWNSLLTVLPEPCKVLGGASPQSKRQSPLKPYALENRMPKRYTSVSPNKHKPLQSSPTPKLENRAKMNLTPKPEP